MTIDVVKPKVVDLKGAALPDRNNTLTVVHDILDQIKIVACEERVVGVALVLLHEDGAMTRAFHVQEGNWTQTLGAVEHLKWAIHNKYNGDDASWKN